MSLTFSTAQTRMGVGILRDDLAANYGEFLNEAIQEIENRRDWLHMKQTIGPVTITGSVGENSTALPANFKSLQKRTPVYFICSDGSYLPAHVRSEAQRIRQASWYSPRIFGYTYPGIQIGCSDSWPPPVFVEITGIEANGTTQAILGIVVPVSQDTSYRVDYYGFSAPMVAPTDTNPLLVRYPKMVLAKAKAIAFSEINDPIAEGFEAEFEKKFSEAYIMESHAEVAGRELRL